MTFLFVVLTSVASNATAGELPLDLTRAIDNLERLGSREWGYSRTVEEGKSVRVERYEPGAEDPWTLLSIDGASPSERERRRYAKRTSDRRNRDHPGMFVVREMVDVERLVVIEETASHAVYRFRPLPDGEEDEEIVRSLVGSLRIGKDCTCIEWLEVRNIEPISPHMGVRIERMHMRLMFAPPGVNKPAFVVAIENDIEARIAKIKKVTQRERIRFHDFAPAAGASPDRP